MPGSPLSLRPVLIAFGASLAIGACKDATVRYASDGGGPIPRDASADASIDGDDANGDAGIREAGGDDANDADAPPFVVGLRIVSAYGTALEAAPGDAVPLQVELQMSDGTTGMVNSNRVHWTAPETIVAENPEDAGPDGLPEAGPSPTAFFIDNPYRQSTPGVLFVIEPGGPGTITVEANVDDAGPVSANVNLLPIPVGDAASGENLFLYVLQCANCHGPTGGGSPPALSPDGGPILDDGGALYFLEGSYYPYPAPGLNATPDAGFVATDPAWNAALVGMAAQSDMDNLGVALRAPMPYWLGSPNAQGAPVGAQDFADIYAWLRTQTQ